MARSFEGGIDRPIERLIKQYSSETRKLEKYMKSLDDQDPLAVEEAETVSGMLSDMRFALEWMRSGRRPGNRRGIDRTNIYRQRELLTELRKTIKPSAAEEKNLLLTILSLSERERACFLLHVAHGLTISEIADRFELSRASIQSYVTRAKSKVEKSIS